MGAARGQPPTPSPNPGPTPELTPELTPAWMMHGRTPPIPEPTPTWTMHGRSTPCAPPPNNRPLSRPPHLEDAESRWGLLAGAGPFRPTFQAAGQIDLKMQQRRAAAEASVSRNIQRGFSLQHSSAGYPVGSVQHMMRPPQAPSLQQPGAAHGGAPAPPSAWDFAELQRSQSEMVHPAPNPQRMHHQQFSHSLHALVKSGLSYAGWQADVIFLRNDAAMLVAADWTSECFQRWLHMNRRIAHIRAKQHFCTSNAGNDTTCRALPCQWQRNAEQEDAPEENLKRERGGAEAEADAEAAAAVADGGAEEAAAGEGAETAVEVKCSGTEAGRLHEQLLVAQGPIMRREEGHGASARGTRNGAVPISSISSMATSSMPILSMPISSMPTSSMPIPCSHRPLDDVSMVDADERADFEQLRCTSAEDLRQHEAAGLPQLRSSLLPCTIDDSPQSKVRPVCMVL